MNNIGREVFTFNKSIEMLHSNKYCFSFEREISFYDKIKLYNKIKHYNKY